MYDYSHLIDAIVKEIKSLDNKISTAEYSITSMFNLKTEVDDNALTKIQEELHQDLQKRDKLVQNFIDEIDIYVSENSTCVLDFSNGIYNTYKGFLQFQNQKYTTNQVIDETSTVFCDLD